MSKSLQDFKRFFSESRFWAKIPRHAKQAGIQTIYAALLMYHAYKRPETPRWAKGIVLGALGYLIAPIDWLPDLTPVIGYTDDIGVLGFGLVTIAGHINEEVKTKARQQLTTWFGDYSPADIERVDKQL